MIFFVVDNKTRSFDILPFGLIEMVRPKNSEAKIGLPLDETESIKSLKTIRQMWEFCLLVQFVSFFGPTLLKLSANEEPDVNQIEEELLGYSYPTQDNSEFQLLTKIEKGIVGLLLEPRFRVDFDNDIKRIYHQRYGKSRACDVDTEDLIEIDQDTGKVIGLKRTYKAMSATEKIRILAQLVRWISVDDRLRDRIDENSPEEFRINPFGYEGEFGTYFLFDDNRLYYREEKNKRPAAAAEKNGTKKRKRGAHPIELEADEPRWECVCWDEPSWNGFVGGGGRMMKQVRKDILPVIAEDEQAKRDSAVWRSKQRERAILVANRKRSSRIEQRKKKEEEEEEQQKQLEREKRQREMEKERFEQERAREERFRKREELRAAQLDNAGSSSSSRTSSRSTRSVTRSWEFDCECGIYGTNYDDGELSVACDQCDTWMHVRCLDQETQKQILADQNGNEDTSQFQFICSRCRRKSQTQPPPSADGPPTPTTTTIQDKELQQQSEVPQTGNRPSSAIEE